MVRALQRLREVRALQSSDVDLTGVPTGHVRVLARYAQGARAQSLQRLARERRLATLLAFARVLEATAQDDVLDVVDRLLSTWLTRVERREQRLRLRTIGDLDAAALVLRAACLPLLDLARADAELRTAVFRRVPRERLLQAAETVARLARPPEAPRPYEGLLRRYSLVRQFLPLLLQTIDLQGTPAAQPVLDAWRFLCRLESEPKPLLHAAPLRVVTSSWRPLVLSLGSRGVLVE